MVPILEPRAAGIWKDRDAEFVWIFYGKLVERVDDRSDAFTVNVLLSRFAHWLSLVKDALPMSIIHRHDSFLLLFIPIL